MRDTPDLPFAHEAARAAGTRHADVVLDAADLVDSGNRRRALVAGDVPIGGELFTSPMREISYLHLTRFVQHLLDRKDRMSMAKSYPPRSATAARLHLSSTGGPVPPAHRP